MDYIGNELWLTYKHITLHKLDLYCLPPPNYINDLIISFYYEVLNDKFKEYSAYFALLDPVVTISMISDNSLSEINEVIYTPLDLKSKKYIFIPINDNKVKKKFGDKNHWALCLLETETGNLYYLDSMVKSMDNVKLFIDRYEQLSNTKITFVNGLKEKCQYSDFDCGVFVMAFTEELLNYMSKTGFNPSFESTTFDYIIVKSKIAQQVQCNEIRREIFKTIERIKKLQNTKPKAKPHY